MNEQAFAELSAGHALRSISSEDESVYRDTLDAHPEWTSYADDDAETAAMLADGVDEVAPPAAVRADLLAKIGAPGAASDSDVRADAGNDVVMADAAADADAAPAAHAAPAQPPVAADELDDDDPRISAPGYTTGSPATEQIQTVQRRNWTRSLFALTASIALLVGIGWGVGSLTEQMRAPTADSVLAQIERSGDARSNTSTLADGGEATVHWSPNVEGAVLVVDGLPEIDADQSYEAWFVRGAAPVPAGAFESSDGSAEMLLEGAMQPDDIIALTVEQSGGSPTGLPTSDPIVAIPTSA
ncbi:MAG: anti-sigma factor [Microbacterium arborescens]